MSILLSIWRNARRDRLTTEASSVAFYLMLGIVPGIAAFVSVTGLVADEETILSATSTAARVLPDHVRSILLGQVSRFLDQRSELSSVLFRGSIVWFVIVMWSANRGMRGLIGALNAIHDSVERRGFGLRLMVSLGLTLGAIIVLAVGFAAAIRLPGLDSAGTESLLTAWLSWALMLILTVTAHALLFRFGPSRATKRWLPILAGSAAGTMLWLAVSGLFSLYVNQFGSLTALYGPLGSVVAFMTWLWLSALATLLGAEIDTVLSNGGGKGRSNLDRPHGFEQQHPLH